MASITGINLQSAVSLPGQTLRYWNRKGTLATLLAILRTLVQFVVRHRCRLVFEAPLSAARQPSVWGPEERFLVYGPDNLHEISPQMLSTLETDRHMADFRSLRDGNRLFVVAHGETCLHRGYVCTVDRPDLELDRKAVFFGELHNTPMIRGSETTRHAGDKNIVRHVRRALFTRVLNEQLRYLQSAGYRSAVLFIMAENTSSIKGVIGAGFQLSRVLNDWIFFRSLLVQKVCEKGSRKWRVLSH